MMLKFLFFVSGLFIFLESYCQNKFEIHFKIEPLKKKRIFFGYHYGENQYVTDTIFLNDNSEAVIKKNNLPKGIYFVALSNMKYASFIITQPGKYKIVSDTLKLLRNLKIENSKENEVFIEYQIKLNDYKKEISNIEKRITQYPDSNAVLSLLIDNKTKEWNNYLNELINKNPNLLATKIISLLRFKDFNFDANTYFTDVDFTDETLLFTPVFSTIIDNFFASLPPLTVKNIDSLQKAIDFILTNSMKNPIVYEELAKYMIGQFDLTGDYPNPDAFSYIAEKYFLTDLAPWVNEGFKVRLKKYIQKLKTVTINEVFPSLTLHDINDRIISIPEKKSHFSIIIFWDPNCEHCIEYLRKLKNTLYSYENLVDVYCINTGNKPDEWRKTIRQESFTWKHFYDKKLLNDFVEELFLYNTPQVFVLDKAQRIIAKDVMPEEIVEWIKQ